MAVDGNYFALQLSAQNTNLAAYYYVNLGSSGAVTGSAVTIYPSSTSATYVSQSQAYLQFQAPPSRTIGAGISVLTDDTRIAGTLGASPALSVPVTLQCFGAGKVLGTVTLPAGQTEIPYNFNVSASEAIPGNDLKDVLAKLAPRP